MIYGSMPVALFTLIPALTHYVPPNCVREVRQMATIRKRGRRVYAEVRVAGQRVGRSFDTMRAARVWSAEQEEAILSGRRRAEPRTLRDGLQRYARDVSPTKRGARWELLRLAAFERDMTFVDRLMSLVHADDIAGWRDDRLKVVMGASVARDMTLLGSVFEQARLEWRWVSVNPVRDVRKPSPSRPREQRVSDEDAALIYAMAGYVVGGSANDTLQVAAAAFAFAIETAMRASEVLSLSGETIDVDGRCVTLLKTKNGSTRQVPLSRGALFILRGLDPDRPFPINSRVLDVTFRRLRDRAGLRHIHFHDSRHEAITRLSRKLDVRDLARMTGHQDLKMLLRYYNPTASEIATRLD